MRALSLLATFSMSLCVLACTEDDASRASERSVTPGMCLQASDCGDTEICVKVANTDASGTCLARCASEEDVCPGTATCTRVVDGTGEALACLPATTLKDRAWHTCADARDCESAQRCIDFGEMVGARCMPACTDGDRCVDAALTCGVRVEIDDDTDFVGCGAPCSTEVACEAGWTCVFTDDVGTGQGLCVR